jgi:peptidoglycan/xylan/chitin deacetylase (PgdA/CDA1 family)
MLDKLVVDQLVILYVHYYPDKDGNINMNTIRTNLQFIHNKCNVLSLNEALDKISRNERLAHRSVCIIVDDATKAFYNYSCPLLIEYELPFTLGIIPGLIKTHNNEHLVSRVMRIAGHKYYLPHTEMIKRASKWLTDEGYEECSSFTDVFNQIIQVPDEKLVQLNLHMKTPDDQFMTWTDIKQLKNFSNVEFASHTMSHPRLEFAKGNWLEWEVERSKKLLEENLNILIDKFVIPYGTMDCMNPEIEDVLVKYGYKYSFMTEKGMVNNKTNHFIIPRVNGEVNAKLFKAITSSSIYSLINMI